MLNELKGFGSVRYYIGDLADWLASSKILAVNEFAIITDLPGYFKQGQSQSSLQRVGPTFANLPLIGGASTAIGLTAFAGGGQANALQLAASFNEVSTVATSGDSVKLPAATPGLSITVKNIGAEALAVFPFLGDSINSLAANASVFIAPGVSKTFRAQDSTVWQETTGPVAVSRTPAAINATATATAVQVASGDITSTSAAATTITLPTTALLAAFLGAQLGTDFSFWIDNSAGANTVTVVFGTGQTALTVLTGENTLTIAAGSVGKFSIYFKSNAAAFVGRVA